MEQNQPWWARPHVRAYYGVLMPVLLAGILIHDVWFHHWNRARTPSSYRIEWNELVVMDAQRTEIWRKAFPQPITPGRGFGRHAVHPPAAFLDVNQDGRKEVLFVQNAADFGQDVVFCYSPAGRELWRFSPPPVTAGGMELQSTVTNFVLAQDAGAAAVGRTRNPMLLVVACSLPAHKGRLHLLDGNGSAQEIFRHEGHLDRVDLADVDRDGISEVVIGGFDAERHQANLHLLHPPGPANKTTYVEAEIFFPRTALNRKLAQENRVSRLGASEGMLQVSTLEWLDEEQHEVCYTFDSRLRPKAWFCDPFPSLRHRLQPDNAVSPGSENDETEELRQKVEVVWRRPS